MADRVHKSLRLDAALADRVKAQAADGETETAAYSRVIEAGLSALEARGERGGGERAGEFPDAVKDVKEGRDDGPLIAELRDHVADLKGQIDRLSEQLAVKDGQIQALTRVTDQAQQLHAMTEQRTAGAIESAEAKEGRRGFLARLLRL